MVRAQFVSQQFETDNKFFIAVTVHWQDKYRTQWLGNGYTFANKKSSVLLEI